VEHPLNGSIEQDGVIEVADLTIKPEMDTGDRTGFEVREIFAEWHGFGSFWENASDGVERQGKN
jgi:hypothetical protein